MQYNRLSPLPKPEFSNLDQAIGQKDNLLFKT